MFDNIESALVITIRTTVTTRGRERLNTGGLAQIEQLSTLARATVTIAEGAIRVDGFDPGGLALLSYELGKFSGQWRWGRFADHTRRTVYPLRLPTRKVVPTAWLLPEDERQKLSIYFANGLQLVARQPSGVGLSPSEARFFWGDLFWLQPPDDSLAWWPRLANFGIPRAVTLSDRATEEMLVEIAVEDARRDVPRLVEFEGHRSSGGERLRVADQAIEWSRPLRCRDGRR